MTPSEIHKRSQLADCLKAIAEDPNNTAAKNRAAELRIELGIPEPTKSKKGQTTKGKDESTEEGE